MIIGTRYAHLFIQSIQPIKLQVIPVSSRSVPILNNEGEPSLILPVLSHETEIDSTAGLRETSKRDVKREYYVVQLAKGLLINAKTSNVVSINTKFSGNAEMRPDWRTQAQHPSMVANGLIEGAPGKTFFVYLTNFGTQSVYVPEHMQVAYPFQVESTIHKPTEEMMQALTEKFDLPTTPTTHDDTTVGLVRQRESAEQKIDRHRQVIDRDKANLAEN